MPEAESDKKYPEKIARIVEDISKLTLLETAQLNELLKVHTGSHGSVVSINNPQSTLNIQDIPMMTAGVMPAVATQVFELLYPVKYEVCILLEQWYGNFVGY